MINRKVPQHVLIENGAWAENELINQSGGSIPSNLELAEALHQFSMIFGQGGTAVLKAAAGRLAAFSPSMEKPDLKTLSTGDLSLEAHVSHATHLTAQVIASSAVVEHILLDTDENGPTVFVVLADQNGNAQSLRKLPVQESAKWADDFRDRIRPHSRSRRS